MGKNIGGTLGAPFEWRRQVNNVEFYTEDLVGDPVPNDDLDIQMLWLIMLEEKGINVDSSVMADYWQTCVSPFWVEYGTAKINMQTGLLPPFTGIRNNDYKHSCGAFIRTEIWACIAPGRPHIAVKYAYEDAILDHGDGEGTYATVFCAAMESAAFIEKDIGTLIEIGLSYIPEDCAVAGAVRLAVKSYKDGDTWLEARNKILEEFRGSVFLGNMSMISREDIDKGFDKGPMGFDAPSNIGIIIIGLLYGENNFDRSLCVTVNCGEDTDCTAATLGALYGIINGIESIPQKWIDPIGKKIKIAYLNIGDLGFLGALLPADLDELTDRTEKLMRKIAARQGLPVELPGLEARPPEKNDLYANDKIKSDISTPATRLSFPFYDISLEYVSGITVKPDEDVKLRLSILSKNRAQAGLNIHCYTPENWDVKPAKTFKSFVGQRGWEKNSTTVELQLSPSGPVGSSNRFVIEITVDGRSAVMLIPVHLLVEY